MTTPPKPLPSTAASSARGAVLVAPAAADRRAEVRLLTAPFARMFAVQTAFGLSFAVFALLPKFLAERGATASDVGLVMSMWGVAGALVSPWMGPLLDRHGRRPFILAGMVVMATSAFAYGAVDGFGFAAVALRFAQGAAFALVFNGVMALVADRIPGHRLGQAIGLMGAASLATNAVGPAIAEPAAIDVGWPWTFLGAGAVASFGVVAALFVREPTRRAVAAARRAPERPLLASSAFRGVLVGNLGCGIGLGVLMAFHQPYALELGIERVSQFFVAYTVAGLIVRLPLGSLVDRLGPRPMAIGSLALYTGVVAAGAALGPLGLVPLGAALGLAHGVFFPSITAFAMNQAGPGQRGRVMALLNASFCAGIAGSVAFLGVVAERYGYPVLFLSAAAMMVVGVVALVVLTRRHAAAIC